MLIIDLAESEVFCMSRENKTRHVIIKDMKRACALFYEEMVKGELEVVKR